ncbi:MAG TPA: amino acid ABC transporter permease [Rhodopila sp.]
MNYHWHFEILWTYRFALLRAAQITFWLTLFSLAIGIAMGLTFGLLRSSRNGFLRVPAGIYVEFFRSTPSLVQIVWIYYALPVLTGVQMGNMTAASIGFGLHSGAYFAETFRGGIASIHRGQFDAARAIGMRYGTAMRRIILPQAYRRMLPPFINEVANLIKLTTLGSTIAVSELLHTADSLISETYRPLEFYTALALAFFLFIFPVIWLAQRLEHMLGARS